VDVAATGEGVSSLGSAPLSGTSYAAPVVSGLAALIRARFPTLNARQVMRRIESTAHHPPTGRDPLVGNGMIDALAAVSTDWSPPGNPATPAPVSVPLTTPPASKPPNSHARDTALGGAAICLVALAGALATGAARGRLRRSRHCVPGD